jgi:uncharacterized protein (DUF433 family)
MGKNRIIVDPKVHFGKPYIAGTRISVENVLELLEEGILWDDIINKFYPDLTREDIKACIHYASEIVHSEEIYIGGIA